MDKTRDWVVLYWEHDGHEDQATVVTEYRGPLTGRRVVRGRERECLAHWARETERRLREERYRRIARGLVAFRPHPGRRTRVSPRVRRIRTPRSGPNRARPSARSRSAGPSW